MVFVLINAHFLPTSIPLNTSQLKNKMVSQAYLSSLYSKILISQDTAYTSPFLSGLSFVEGSHVFSRLLHQNKLASLSVRISQTLNF